MSVPPYLRLPGGVTRERLAGDVAALCAGPAGGRSGPDALLLPGFTGSKEDFVAVLPPLAAAGYRAVAIDLPGQLDSPGPDDPAAYSPDRLAATVRRVVAELRAPVHLVGHSYGGFVARAAVLAAPQLARSLTLLDTGAAAVAGPAAERLRLLQPVLASAGVEGVWAASRQLDEADPRYAAPAPEVLAFLRHRFLASPPAALAGMSQALLCEPDRVDELARLGLPMLVAAGAGEDVWPAPLQRELAGRLGVRFAVIEGATHSPAAENRAATARVLVDFWCSADADVG